MKHEDCQNSTLIEIVREDIKEIKKDIKALLKFKYQVLAISGFVSVVASLIIKKVM